MKIFFTLITFVFMSIISFSQDLDKKLIDAVYKNDEKAVFDLIRRGADVNAETSFGVTPLMYAVQNGNYLICQKLISSGANVNSASDDAIDPIINAVINQDTAITLLLLENGANPDAVDKIEMQSALMFAIGRSNIFLSEALLYYGADPNKMVYDVSPLMHSIYLGVDTSFINQLISYGAKPDLKNSKGYNSLTIATLYENTAATKILLKNNLIPDTSSISEYNPMKIALKYQLDEFVEILTPYYKEKVEYYHSQALLKNYYKGAKIIRKYSGNLFLTPVLSSLIIGTNFTFNHTDVLWAFKIGVSESRYNFDVKVAIQPRLSRKAVLYELRPDFYLQLWEKRTLLTAEFDKRFIFYSNSKSTSGLNILASYNYSFGNYSGFNEELNYRKAVSFGGGIWFKENFFRTSFNYQYLPIQSVFPHYFSIEIEFLIPFVF